MNFTDNKQTTKQRQTEIKEKEKPAVPHEGSPPAKKTFTLHTTTDETNKQANKQKQPCNK